MGSGVLSGTALVVIFIIALVAGLVMVAGAILSLLRSFTPGRQAKTAKSAAPIFSRATVYSIGLGAAAFGAMGLIVQLLFKAVSTSLVWALGAGLLVGLIALILLVYLPSRGRIEEKLLDIDAAGRRAQVIITVPANGIGEISFADGGKPVNLGARSATGQPVIAGTTVVIERVTQRVAVVSPLPEDGLTTGNPN